MTVVLIYGHTRPSLRGSVQQNQSGGARRVVGGSPLSRPSPSPSRTR